jgi:hypothetical protein
MKKLLFHVLVCAFSVPLLFFAGCSNSPRPISVSLSSPATQTDQGLTIPVTASLTNDTSLAGVSWTLTGPGSLSNASVNAVTFVAPANVPNQVTTLLTATSVADITKTKSLQLTVNPPPQLSILQSLPSGTTGMAYDQAIIETGGTPPFTWSLSIGALPLGLNLNSSTGAISGTPTGGGTWYFWAHMTDAAGLSTQNPFLSIKINSNIAPGNAVPFVNQPLIPDAAAPGGPGLTLTVNGTGFVSGATVSFNGAPLATSFLSSHQLTAVVPPFAIATAGTASITVVNPSPGGGRSNAVLFPVAATELTVNFSNAPGSPIPAYGAQSVAIGDFNGDGKSDLAASYSVRVASLLGNGDGTFAQATGSPILMQYPPWDTLATPYSGLVAVGDFNNSGRLGLATVEFQSSAAAILLGNGNGSFTPSSTFAYTSGMPTMSLAAADFNGDGNLDLAVGNLMLGLPVNILLGYGAGAFNQVVQSPFGLQVGVTTIAVGDFNSDGKLDLVLGTFNPSTGVAGLVILLGNGDGTFALAPGSPIASGLSYSVAVADFNGDGKLDLAVANNSSNSVEALLGNGDGTFTKAAGSPIQVGAQPYSIVAGDFLGSGKIGLAVANFGSNNITILAGNGDGTFSEAGGSPVPVGKGPISIAAADFNGSGRLGLAVANLTDGTISILLQH